MNVSKYAIMHIYFITTRKVDSADASIGQTQVENVKHIELVETFTRLKAFKHFDDTKQIDEGNIVL